MTTQRAVFEWRRQLGAIVDHMVDEIHEPLLGEDALDQFQQVVCGNEDGVAFAHREGEDGSKQFVFRSWALSGLLGPVLVA